VSKKKKKKTRKFPNIKTTTNTRTKRQEGKEKLIYMEISQGNSLYSYLHHKQAKLTFFPLFSVFFYNIGE
jgi:hypothetical protein